MTDTQMPELKPCPFCGGCNIAGHSREFESHYRTYIRCVDCDYELSEMAQSKADSVYKAETKWNTRADTPTSDARKAAKGWFEKFILNERVSDSQFHKWRVEIETIRAALQQPGTNPQAVDMGLLHNEALKFIAAQKMAISTRARYFNLLVKLLDHLQSQGYLQQPDTSYDPALYNADMDQLEFVTEDTTVVAHPINGWFNVLRKNGTDEIIGLQLNGPIAYAKHITGQCECKPDTNPPYIVKADGSIERDTSEAVRVLVAAVSAAETKFQDYALLHRSKETEEGRRKAEFNLYWANEMFKALRHPAVIAAMKGV